MARKLHASKASEISSVYRLPSAQSQWQNIGDMETQILRCHSHQTPSVLVLRRLRGLGLHTTSLPNIVFLPALSPFLLRVLTTQRRGIINLPAFSME